MPTYNKSTRSASHSVVRTKNRAQRKSDGIVGKNGSHGNYASHESHFYYQSRKNRFDGLAFADEHRSADRRLYFLNKVNANGF